MSKKGIIISIISLIVVLVLLIGTLVAGLFGNFSLNFINREYKKVVFSKTYDIKDINIDASVGNVYLKYATDDKVKVEIASKEKYVTVTDDEDSINITVKGPKCKFLCVNTKASRVTVYLPKDYAQKISVDLDMGDLKASKFKKLSLDVQNDMGDVKLDGVSRLTGKLNMGDFKVKNIYNYVNIKNNMGDIKIDNLTITKDSTIKSSMGDIKIKNTNNIYIDAHVNMGDVKIKNNKRKAKNSLKITNHMGDIKVNY